MTRIEAVAAFGRRALPNHWDLIALAAMLAVFAAMARAYHGMSRRCRRRTRPVISLDYWNLPYYALRTTLRMFAALVSSLVFTFTYATLAAKSRRAEMVLIPMLDILQSVPILGFLSFTVTFFLGLFPGNVLGAECAAIFAIFTSQAWNMAFSFYQSLRTVPRDLDEVARGFRLTGWQKFWQLEAPFAMPSLIWNTMMSMSGGWFFVVASEAITVGDTTITLPGDRLLYRQGQRRGRLERRRRGGADDGGRHPRSTTSCCSGRSSPGRPSSGSNFRPARTSRRPGCSTCLQRTHWVRAGLAAGLRRAAQLVSLLPHPPAASPRPPAPAPIAGAIANSLDVDLVSCDRRDRAAWAAIASSTFVATELVWGDVGQVVVLTFYTLLRVVVLMALATHRLGADQRLDRAAAALGGGGAAAGAVPRRLSRQSAVRRGGQPRADLPSQSGHLAQLADRVRHAMVHRVQHDRRRGRPSPTICARRRRIFASAAGTGGRRSCCRASRPIISPARSPPRAAPGTPRSSPNM